MGASTASCTEASVDARAAFNDTCSNHTSATTAARGQRAPFKEGTEGGSQAGGEKGRPLTSRPTPIPVTQQGRAVALSLRPRTTSAHVGSRGPNAASASPLTLRLTGCQADFGSAACPAAAPLPHAPPLG